MVCGHVQNQTESGAPLTQKWLILIFENGIWGMADSLWVNVAERALCGPPAELLCQFCFYVFIKCVAVVMILTVRNSGAPCFLSSGGI